MANPAWYNDNQFRDYPFITRIEPLADATDLESEAGEQLLHLPQSTILDCGLIMDIDAEFNEAEGHMVYLHSVARFADTFTFKFRTTAPAADNYELVFYRELTTTEFEISWEAASTIAAEVVPPLVCATESKWRGFLATGSLTDLAAIIDNGETIVVIPGLWQIEPARIQSLMQSYLRSISLANAARLLSTPVAGCESDSSETGEEPAIINATCLTGAIQWREGFNCSIRQDVNTNSIIIGAGVGIGEGLPCEELPLYPEEEPPEDSPFLSGGPACTEILKSLNGVGGANINIVAGAGFRIQPDTLNPHRLIIDRDLNEFAICQIPDDFTNSSLSLAEEP